MNKFETKEELKKEMALRFTKKLSHFKKIKVKMGKFQNVGYCHINVRQALEEGSSDYGAEAVYILPNGLIRYHFIEAQRDKKKKFTYTDNTLGYLSKDMTYYLIKNFTLRGVKGKEMLKVLEKGKYKFLKGLFTAKEINDFEINYDDL